MRYVLWNGQCVPENEAVVPVNERAFLYGDGIFTTMVVQEGKICFFSEHLDRFTQDCIALSIAPPEVSLLQLSELIRSNNAGKGEWRLKVIVTGGRAESLDLPKERRGSTLALLTPYKREAGSDYRVVTFPTGIASPLMPYKTLAYLERLYLKQYAHDRGVEDVLVLSPEGFLLDLSFSNLFWTDGKSLYIPDLSLGYQLGVTLSVLTTVAQKQGFSIIHGKWRLVDLPNDASLYRCNSLVGVQAISEVDGYQLNINEKFEVSVLAAYNLLRTASAITPELLSNDPSCGPCGN